MYFKSVCRPDDIRPITSALQTVFNKVAQIGNGNGGTNGEATGWVKAMDFGRQTQQLGNLGPVIMPARPA